MKMKNFKGIEFVAGTEVVLTKVSGEVITGKMVDQTLIGSIWIEDAKGDWHITTELDTLEVQVATIKEAHDVKNITAIKAEYKEELAEQWEDVEYNKVMVYNSDEDGVEVYDAEFNAYSEEGELLFTVAFGTYYDEKEAVKASKAMRTKLAKYFVIKGSVEVYAC